MKDIALGSFEAAAVMGLHWTRPKRLYDAGKLDARPLDQVWPRATTKPRAFLVYSLASAEENWKESAAGRITARRPRENVDLRKPALARIAAAEPILYDDAIGTAEAARICGVHWTMIPKLVADGKIVARRPWNPRRSGGKLFIISRKSCEHHRREVAAAEKAGTKKGRRRFAKTES